MISRLPKNILVSLSNMRKIQCLCDKNRKIKTFSLVNSSSLLPEKIQMRSYVLFYFIYEINENTFWQLLWDKLYSYFTNFNLDFFFLTVNRFIFVVYMTGFPMLVYKNNYRWQHHKTISFTVALLIMYCSC